jgi:phosphoribosylanthranilate isomerase
MIKVKVCGMLEPLNIKDIAGAGPDYMGFIFYSGSKRYTGDIPDPGIFRSVPSHIIKTGVFVDEDKEKILKIASMASLGAVQLHGSESVGFCEYIKASGLVVIKAFRVGPEFEFDYVNLFEDVCDYFLFDTKSEVQGGSGKKFNWELLERYNSHKPFFLSGGIGPEDISTILSMKKKGLYAVDINSLFETAPGIKDVVKVKAFIKEIKEYTYEV